MLKSFRADFPVFYSTIANFQAMYNFMFSDEVVISQNKREAVDCRWQQKLWKLLQIKRRNER